MASPSRGMANIHTMAGRSDGPVKPHKVYLRLSCLEMEKTRLNIEKAAAQKRIDRINVRTAEIDAEKKKIIAVLPSDEPRAGGNLGKAQKPTAAMPRGKSGMAFRY